MAQAKVQQPRQMAIQGRSVDTQGSSVFQRIRVGSGTKFKDAVWPRHGTETMAQLGRLLRGKLPK